MSRPEPSHERASEPIRGLAELSRSELAVLGREYLLAGQLMDRAGMPHIIAEFGREVMGQIAIDEWMGASPVYTPRMQKLLNFANGDVETIFKGMQFDIGAPPEFMDFRYKVIDANHGEFWLDHCGALMDVEPMGDDYVTTMCHTIEDPTFDATAIATNRRARMEPIHRPPRMPADRHPHCHWTVTIDDDVEPLLDPEPMAAIAATLLARSEVARPVVADHAFVASDGGDEFGCSDYSWPLDPDLKLEAFSQPLLVAVLQEVAVQSHLLVMAMVAAIEKQASTELATGIALKQFVGSAGLTAERVASALGLGDTVGALAQVLVLHPAFNPSSYVDLVVKHDPNSGTLNVELRDCDALREVGRDNWISILADGHYEALNAIAYAINPSFEFESVERTDGVVGKWQLLLRDRPVSERESKEVALTRFSTGADFEFAAPHPVPVSLSPRRP